MYISLIKTRMKKSILCIFSGSLGEVTAPGFNPFLFANANVIPSYKAFFHLKLNDSFGADEKAPLAQRHFVKRFNSKT